MGKDNRTDILVIWRNKHMKIEVNSDSEVKEFGLKLLNLTKVKPETMKLLVPISTNKGSKLVVPFSAEHSSLSLREAAIVEGKSIRMMGVSEDEIEEVSQNDSKLDLRIAGFDEEEKRLRQRLVDTHQAPLKLPQGAYIFCDFVTLHIPGIELNPPSSEALRRMHMLACDPGIIAIMNKHRWRVAVMTEMAPVGYVGISPKCILGFNKNHGEEISLRLRTDDLKGFRKYESIKKTLLHELAHMVHSEHDANFYELDKQLNQEADSLDWTKSRSHTLSGRKISNHYVDELHSQSSYQNTGQKIGGATLKSSSANAMSVAAAYSRFASSMGESQNVMEENEMQVGCPRDLEEPTLTTSGTEAQDKPANVDPDGITKSFGFEETDPHNSMVCETGLSCKEPDPNERGSNVTEAEPDPDASRMEGDEMQMNRLLQGKAYDEPDPDDCKPAENLESSGNSEININNQKSVLQSEPDPDQKMDGSTHQELDRIEAQVVAICERLKKSFEKLRSEVAPLEASSSLQTLFKIVRNVIEHPGDVKFRRLRKGNPLFQRNVANHKAAMEVLDVVGFSEDVVTDEAGRSETYLVLRRDDPGLLWLAKSLLEVSIA